VWSGNKVRHRLPRTGNRQLNCAIHRMAVTQMRISPQAQAYLNNRIAADDTKPEALRALKRRISDAVYRALLTDATSSPAPIDQAA
jgi:transposase